MTQASAHVKGKLVDPLLSVVMPVYNERDTIEEIIRRVLAVPVRTQLIVVDDGSKDGTREILARLRHELDFELVLQERNQGKGAACDAASRRFAGDIVVIQDADLEYSTRRTTRSCIQPICRGGRTWCTGRGSSGRHRVFMFSHYRRATGSLTLLTNMLYNTIPDRHGDLLQGLPGGDRAGDAPAVERLRHRAGDDGEDRQGAATGSTKSRSPTTAAATRKARRSPGATASSPCGCCSSTGLSIEPSPAAAPILTSLPGPPGGRALRPHALRSGVQRTTRSFASNWSKRRGWQTRARSPSTSRPALLSPSAAPGPSPLSRTSRISRRATSASTSPGTRRTSASRDSAPRAEPASISRCPKVPCRAAGTGCGSAARTGRGNWNIWRLRPSTDRRAAS